MKKYILLCFVCFGLHNLSHAQWYVKGYTGYSLATGNEKLTSREEISLVEYSDDYQLIRSIYEHRAHSYRMKLGQGVNLGLSAGYALNKHLAFEITGNTQVFSKFSYSNPSQLSDIRPEGNGIWSSYRSTYGFFGELEYSSTLFQFSPQIVFRSNPYNQWTFYLKGGPNFVWINHKQTILTTQERLVGDYPYFEIQELTILGTTKFSGGINVGLQCSFGVEYELAKNIGIFAELTTVNTNYTFMRSEILRAEIDGVNVLSELEQTKFDDLDEKVKFSHTGLNIGIKYSF